MEAKIKAVDGRPRAFAGDLDGDDPSSAKGEFTQVQARLMGASASLTGKV
jgi:hypothetical protein